MSDTGKERTYGELAAEYKAIKTQQDWSVVGRGKKCYHGLSETLALHFGHRAGEYSHNGKSWAEFNTHSLAVEGVLDYITHLQIKGVADNAVISNQADTIKQLEFKIRDCLATVRQRDAEIHVLSKPPVAPVEESRDESYLFRRVQVLRQENNDLNAYVDRLETEIDELTEELVDNAENATTADAEKQADDELLAHGVIFCGAGQPGG